MKLYTIVLLLAAIIPSAIITNDCGPRDYSFYIKVDSGISCSGCTNISVCSPPWTVATQGYNSKMGNRPIAGASIGCELAHLIDFEFNISNRAIFKYRQCQSPVGDSIFYTRRFDLNITSVLFNVNFLGRGTTCLNWETACGTIYPVFGAGVGASDLLITNFRTTGLPANGDSAPFGSFSTENEYTLRRHFTYALLAGFEYNHEDRWAISTGYRWFNAGRFNGPQYLRLDSGSAIDVAGAAWGMRFRANEWFVEFKIFI